MEHLKCHAHLGTLLYSVRARKTVRKLAAEELFDYAVKYLSLQGCSSEELRTKLRVKAAAPADIDSVIDRLKDIGYLDDRRFAESYASNRAENDGFGRMRVLRDLRARRVAAGLADQTVAQVFEGKDESELIDAFIVRRMPAIAAGGVDDERAIAAAYRKLRRAGFSSGNILTVLKRLAQRPELLDEEPADEDEE